MRWQDFSSDWSHETRDQGQGKALGQTKPEINQSRAPPPGPATRRRRRNGGDGEGDGGEVQVTLPLTLSDRRT